MRTLSPFMGRSVLLALSGLPTFNACGEASPAVGTAAVQPGVEAVEPPSQGEPNVPARPGLSGASSSGAGSGESNPGPMQLVGEATEPAACPGASACGPLPAFPGADGAGGYVSGGRGGDVYHVTRLDTDSSDLAPGTLRFGVSNLSAPRTIVFDVSGVFSLGRAAVAGWDDNGNGWDTSSRLNIPSNVTIAGQTAPGPVIITGGTLKAGGANFILRNISVAPGYGSRGFDEPNRPPVADDFPDSYTYDAIDISGHDLIIDHVTTVYATDETVSMNETVDNATVQYSNISQGQNYPQADAEATGLRYTGHALGSLLQGGSNARISIHHNLYAHQKGRLPRVGTELGSLTVADVGAYNDFRNNVFYNWFGTAGTGASGQPSQNNFIANFFLAGPGGEDASGGTSTAVVAAAGGTAIFDGKDPINTRVHHDGNLKDLNVDGDAQDGVPLTDLDYPNSLLQPLAFSETRYDGVTDTADVALQRVLDYVGSSWWNRAPLDQRILLDVRTGSGKIVAWADNPFDASAEEGVEWRALVNTAATSRPAGFDTDQDGMPDDWEVEHGLDPAVADNNGDFDADGYTNLEEYLNEIAAWPAPTPAQFTGQQNQRYAQIQNWSLLPGPNAAAGNAPWQPSRYDLAQISTATVVDAVGQHAGALDVSAAAGTASLEIVAGWLAVEGSLSVGSRASWPGRGREPGAGRVTQSGGVSSVGAAVVLGGPAGATGELNLTGGVLSTPQLLATGGGHFNFTGGTLRADVVGFDLVNAGGVLMPGSAVAISKGPTNARQLEIRGSLSLQRGVLRIGLSPRHGDALRVAGDLQLGGALELELAEGFTPRSGDAWTIATAQGSVHGRFEQLPAGFHAQIRGSRVLVSYGSLPFARSAVQSRRLLARN